MVRRTTSHEPQVLQREDWIRAAIEALREGGIDAVRVDAIAPRLGVTRGSFYWHFADRADLLEALLRDWESETPEIIAGAASAATPYYRLMKFFSLAEASQHPPDAAIFAWARREMKVAQRVAVVEEARVAFFEAQIRELGVERRQAARIAEILYVATLGWLERRARSPHRTASFAAFGRTVSHLLLTLLPPEAGEHIGRGRRPKKEKR